MMGKRGVMLADGFRNPCLGYGKIQELRYIGHIDFLRTGGTMTAIHAMPRPVNARKGLEGEGIVLLFIRGILIGNACEKLLRRMGPGQHYCHGRTGQGVVYALGHRQREKVLRPGGHRRQSISSP